MTATVAASWFCEYCLCSVAALAHPTLGRVCEHCLRPVRATRQRNRQRRNRSRSAAMCARLAERDGGWICHLCGKPIDPEGRGGKRPSLDHVVPRSQGGVNALENLKLAHSRCNMRRGDKPLEAVVV